MRLLSLIGHLYLSGVWLGVILRADTQETCALESLAEYVTESCQ